MAKLFSDRFIVDRECFVYRKKPRINHVHRSGRVRDKDIWRQRTLKQHNHQCDICKKEKDIEVYLLFGASDVAVLCATCSASNREYYKV